MSGSAPHPLPLLTDSWGVERSGTGSTPRPVHCPCVPLCLHLHSPCAALRLCRTPPVPHSTCACTPPCACLPPVSPSLCLHAAASPTLLPVQVMVMDDINLNDEMKELWQKIYDKTGEVLTPSTYTAYDLTQLGHYSGTGLLDFTGGKLNIGIVQSC